MRTLTTEHMRPLAFRAWLENSAPGDTVTYAVGEFGRSIEMSRNSGIHALHELTLDAWYDGKVHLVQRKVGLNLFQYIAVKGHGRRRERPTWQEGFEGGSGRGSKDRADRRDGKKGRLARVEEPIEL